MDVALGILVGLMVPILVIAAIVFLILRMRSGIPMTFTYRGALRVYFYIAILVCVGLLVIGGVSTLLKVGFGEGFGREFSYGSVYEEHRLDEEYRLRSDDEDHFDHDFGYDPRPLDEKVDHAVKSSVINGVSLTGIGLFLLLIHLFGRRWVETADDRSDLLRRIYLLAGLVLSAIITIVSLAIGLTEALRYALLETAPGQESPGEPLSLAIVALPVWLVYLVFTIRNIRSVRDTRT